MIDHPLANFFATDLCLFLSMDQNEITPAPNLPKNHIIDMIRKLRNDLVKDFLDERHLLEFLASRFHQTDLSGDNLSLIKLELREMLISPVDEDHYELLIKQIMQTGSASITEKNEKLFLTEIEQVLKKYLY